ncbi:hypothetical protein EDC56_2956 [Sinobacterium caligoides]|uniref:Uncharacterized protein n=1 Tax=Sinobacterium caligoides TaxID=933926 RepID=A0A3N2DKJ0_9GAMM|nr:hypothetical protein [Sinobacterium caligoides]ROS00310.1 hypothetical protein EDC56_2956 [Sinobacterium caligoides]
MLRDVQRRGAQLLGYADQQLSMLAQADEQQHFGFLEAATHHLYQACRCYLAEVAIAYGVSYGELSGDGAVEELLAVFSAKGLNSGELNELHSADWWQLLRRLQSNSLRLEERVRVRQNPAVIAVQVSDDAGLTRSNIVSIRNEMMLLIQRQRSDAQES